MADKRLADLVNPYIGTISHTLKSTVPAVQRPYGVAKSYPVTSNCSDYFCNEHIDGFPLGRAVVNPAYNTYMPLTIDHHREDCRCYYSKIELDRADMTVESTVTHHVYVYRFTGANRLLIDCENGSFEVFDDEIHALLDIPGVQNQKEHVLIKFSKCEALRKVNSKHIIVGLDDETTVCYGAVSYISIEKAREILEKETGGKSFDDITQESAKIWDELLGRVKIDGNTTDRQITFYTAMYRAFQGMTDYSEYGEYFSAYDGKVHKGDYFYTHDQLWDSFRCMHPLQLLLDSKTQHNIVDSYNIMYKQSGHMPSFPKYPGDSPSMIGFHAAALFADSLAKGLDADYKTAYEGIYKNATEQSMLPWRTNTPATILDECYYKNGFFPALDDGEEESVEQVHHFERRQSIAVTLEHSYDDWCAAQLAKHLGKEKDYEFFCKRAQNYKNLYNSKLGLMAPKNIDGKWVKNFNTKWGGGMGGRDFTAENNTLTYTWSVMHDIDGLIELMGGRDEATEKLDALFEEGFKKGEGIKYEFLGQFPDSTGLMGQFSMGNEPSFHIPYIYNYLGHAWKAQKNLRNCMDIWFTNSPIGICGDEDNGAMSSWFVFSAMGFYPVCPGKPEYAIGTPIFDSVQISLENGRFFKITSHSAGDGKCYIQSARLNGKLLEKLFLSHNDIMSGGELVLEMGTKPNKNR